MFTRCKVPSPKASINEATSKATKIHSTEECTRHITCKETETQRSDLPIRFAKQPKLHPSCCDHRKPQANAHSYNLEMLTSSLPFPTSPF